MCYGEIRSGSVSTQGEPAVPEQPQPSGDVPLSHTRTAAWTKTLACCYPTRDAAVSLRMGTHLACVCQVMEGTWPEGRTAADVGAATNTWAGHSEANRCT